MTAGPYPTKSMFEQVKNRVTQLEARSSGGAGTRPAYSELENVGHSMEGMGVPKTLQMTGTRLVFSWERYSISPAGFYAPGITAADIDGVTVDAGPGIDDPRIAWGEAIERGDGYFDLRYELPVLSQGILTVWLKNPVTLGGFEPASGYTAANLGAGRSITLYAADDSVVSGLPNAYLTILRPSQLPVRPEYIPRGSHDVWPRTFIRSDRAEIIWPAGGTPYLLVIGADDTTYHAPLTPGLPQ